MLPSAHDTPPGPEHAGALRRRGEHAGRAERHLPVQDDVGSRGRPAVGHRDLIVQSSARRSRHRRHGLRHREVGLARIRRSQLTTAPPVVSVNADAIGRNRTDDVEDQQRPGRLRVGGAGCTDPRSAALENDSPFIGKCVIRPGLLTVSWMASGAKPLNETLSNLVSAPALMVSGAPFSTRPLTFTPVTMNRFLGSADDDRQRAFGDVGDQLSADDQRLAVQLEARAWGERQRAGGRQRRATA